MPGIKDSDLFFSEKYKVKSKGYTTVDTSKERLMEGDNKSSTAVSSSSCVNRTVAHRHHKPRFPWPSSILWFLSEANNQTPPDEECVYLDSCRNQSRKKGG